MHHAVNRPDPPEFFDWANICIHDTYCEIISEQIKEVCFNTSILELWGYDFNYNNLSREDIIEKVNEEGLIGHLGPIDLEKYMAPMRDSDGKIIGATALSFTWFGQVNFSDISEDEIHAAEDGQPVSKKCHNVLNNRLE